MRITFLAPVAARRRALCVETRRALDQGHDVSLIAEAGEIWDGEPLDPRVQRNWLDATSRQAPQSALVTWLLIRIPLGILRRLRRGPLERPVAFLRRQWGRRVVKRIERRRNRRSGSLRERYRLATVPPLVRETDPDWLVVHEPMALDLAADFVPDLLDERPAMRITYAFENFSDAEVAHDD